MHAFPAGNEKCAGGGVKKKTTVCESNVNRSFADVHHKIGTTTEFKTCEKITIESASDHSNPFRINARHFSAAQNL